MKAHPFFKLGKNAPSRDDRNLKAASIFKPTIAPPSSYSISAKYPVVRPQMFGNDVLGDCVMAARGNQTLYFKYSETNLLITITEKEIENEYFKETGGQDNGLVMTESFNAWRNGWKASGQNYSIKGYAEINRRTPDQLRSTIATDLGCQLGIELPLSARAEINAGKPWSQTTGKGTTLGSWGGHCVLAVGYDSKYIYVDTWAQIQAMTWGWFTKYCSEAYAIIDAINTSKKKKLIDVKTLDSFLESLAA